MSPFANMILVSWLTTGNTEMISKLLQSGVELIGMAIRLSYVTIDDAQYNIRVYAL